MGERGPDRSASVAGGAAGDEGVGRLAVKWLGGGDNTAIPNETSRPPLATQVSAPMRPPVVSS